MDELQEQIAPYIARLKGPDSEDAYHSLIEAGNAIIPILVAAFCIEQDSTIRARLVEIIWQHRLLQTIDFLAEALNDQSPDVWRSALDGLVTLGGKAVLEVLEAAKQESHGHTESDRIEWIDEAIEQVRVQNV